MNSLFEKKLILHNLKNKLKFKCNLYKKLEYYSDRMDKYIIEIYNIIKKIIEINKSVGNMVLNDILDIYKYSYNGIPVHNSLSLNTLKNIIVLIKNEIISEDLSNILYYYIENIKILNKKISIQLCNFIERKSIINISNFYDKSVDNEHLISFKETINNYEHTIKINKYYENKLNTLVIWNSNPFSDSILENINL